MMKIEDLEKGSGPGVHGRSIVQVHYTGWLDDGTKFDSSLDRNQTLTVTLGSGQVIQGWERGLLGMQQGGRRRLVIPPQLAYGSRKVGSIPPGSTLTFEIELVTLLA